MLPPVVTNAVEPNLRADRLPAMTEAGGLRFALGAFIRSQRELADLSLRQVAALADISNPYVSQIERGLHEPSMLAVYRSYRATNQAERSIDETGHDE